MSPILDISFVRYQVTDLDRMQAFLTDFGLHVAAHTPQALYMRAADASPRSATRSNTGPMATS